MGDSANYFFYLGPINYVSIVGCVQMGVKDEEKWR